MRIVLEEEAYAQFSKDAKALGLTTRELGKQVLESYIRNKPK